MTDHGGNPEPVEYSGPERRRTPLPSGAEIEAWRRDTRDLTQATRELNDHLSELVATKSELGAVKHGMAAYISGTKHQIQRTRRATWLMLACAFLFLTALSLQLHEIQLRECILQPTLSAGGRFWCDVSMPLSSHHGSLQPLVQGGAGARLLGLTIYALLAAGFGFGVALYHSRRREEASRIEADPDAPEPEPLASDHRAD